jgi:CDP-glucose 4,6-dehydratase
MASLEKQFGGVFAGKRVLVTGHTGFKGVWLCEWLLMLGAEVTGLALPPATVPSLFEQLRLSGRVHHFGTDIRVPELVKKIVQEAQPDFVFHLAAQPLVRLSYREPVETWQTNVIGTINLMEALRNLEKPCAAVMVTTDKVYENREWNYGYREEDSLGGYDPYSSSKGAAEIAISAWRRSFFSQGHLVRIASARAGNVIGGGDWAEDRIVPDAMRALAEGKAIPVRNRFSTRPWQHVLEPLSGYLQLAAQLSTFHFQPSLASAFNFGPALSSNQSVQALIEEILKHWPGSWEDRSDATAPHEAGKLNLATDKAFHLLGWQPVWGFERTIAETVCWYHEAPPNDAGVHTRKQIQAYVADASAAQLPWAIQS